VILVTGASGMLGQALCPLLEKKHPVLRVSRRGTGGTKAVELSDENALRSLFESNPIRLVIHTAAYSDVDGCERDPKQAYDSNVLAPKNLAALCGSKNVPWIHVSTDYVFDGRAHSPYKEEDKTGPVNIYGVTKWLGEYYALHSASPCAVVRTSWLFGHGNPNTFVNAILAKLKKGEDITVLDEQTTSPTSVPDLSKALERIAEFLLDGTRKEAGKKWNEIFHVCNTGGTTRLEMTKAMRDVLKLKNRVERTDTIPNRPAIRPKPYTVMSNERFQRTFGMKLRPWQDALAEYVQETQK
jgi:dTDP-4-dehydrorhamnose reductase